MITAAMRRVDVAPAESKAVDYRKGLGRTPNGPAVTFELEVKPELHGRDATLDAGANAGVEIATVENRARAEAVYHAKHPTETPGGETGVIDLQEVVRYVEKLRIEGIEELATAVFVGKVVRQARDMVGGALNKPPVLVGMPDDQDEDGDDQQDTDSHEDYGREGCAWIFHEMHQLSKDSCGFLGFEVSGAL
jgi:hypothetical protein